MAKKIKKYKVGINSETFAISLVESPAIESDFIALQEQKEEKLEAFGSDERHIVYGAVIIPEKDIYRNNGEQEYYLSFTKESIEKMSQEFMREYRQHEVKTDHDSIANECCVVESWIVEDPYRDKSNALGISVPQGTWMAGIKVNNIETWERVKSGELKGFSVESKIFREEFSKQTNENNMDNTNEEMFLDKLRNVLKEFFSSKEKEEPTEIEPTNVELSDKSDIELTAKLEEQPQAEPQPTVEEPKVEEPVVEEPKVEEPKPTEEPKVEEQPKVEDNHLEELINSLKDEIKALKEMNGGLEKKIKDLGKQPSVEPIRPNAKSNGSDTGANGSAYIQWREAMRQMVS